MSEQINQAAEKYADKHFLQDVQIFFKNPYDKAKKRYAKTIADFAKRCISHQWVSV